MKIIPGFEFLTAKHCVTSAMLHLFHFHECPISEEMLLGIGSGVGFVFWQQKGTLPFLGGRANVGRNEEDCLEVTAAERCGVKAEKLSTSSMQKAQKVMIDRLSQDQPLMIQVDMGLMPYFPFYRQFHFGYHMVAAAGYDPQTNEITIADRDGTPYAVPLEQVSAARASTYKPFPPHNTWMDYDFSSFHMPDQTALKTAIKECALGMLRPPIKNLGIKGIQTAMQGMLSWTKSMDDEMLASACANVALYIRADAGTGGGLFRWMYAQFLREAGGYPAC